MVITTAGRDPRSRQARGRLQFQLVRWPVLSAARRYPGEGRQPLVPAGRCPDCRWFCTISDRLLRTADDGLIGTVASAAIRSQSPRGSFAPSLDGSLVGGFSHQVEGEMRTTAVWLARKRDWCSLKVTSRVPRRLSSMASGFSPRGFCNSRCVI